MKRIALAIMLLALVVSCGTRSRSAVQKKADEYALVKITAPDLSGITDNGKEVLNLYKFAADQADSIYWKQVFGDKLLMTGLADEDLKEFALINYGPWNRIDGKPFIEGYGERPLGANFYPADMTAEEFEAFEDPDKDSRYTLVVTGTVFSALPKAFSPAAMSITLTLPTYIGSVTLWTALPPFPRVWGFRYHTTGLKRLSLRAETILSWSPPMAAMVENRPAAAPITSSYMSQVRTPRASIEFITFHGSGVLKAVISRRPSSTMARVYVIGLPLFSLTATENSSSG